MKFVNSVSDFNNQVEKKEHSYSKNGNEINNDNQKTFAKSINLKLPSGDSQHKYFITTYNNSPYDPYGIDSHRESTLRTKLTSVSRQTFDYYLKYLSTKSSIYMTRSQRSFIDG